MDELNNKTIKISNMHLEFHFKPALALVMKYLCWFWRSDVSYSPSAVTVNTRYTYQTPR